MKFGPFDSQYPLRALVAVTMVGLAGCATPYLPWAERPASSAENPPAAGSVTAAGPVAVATRATPTAAPPVAAATAIEPSARPAPVPRSEPAPPDTGDVWVRLRRAFRIAPVAPEKLARDIAWFKKNQKYVDRLSVRAAPYLRYLVDEVAKRDVPGEIVLIPLVESGFQPFAYSSERASGLWQFMPATARRWDLEINSWYDGRRDVIESTRAALDYLEYLNREFSGDWLLSMAAYNSGEGTIKRAMAKNRRAGRPTDFWSIRKHLPLETRAYIPRLLAAARVVADPSAYGIRLTPVPDRPHFEVVDIGGQLDLAIAADLAQVSMEEIYRLNPAFNQWATSPDGPHRLLIPARESDRFRAKLARLPPSARIKWTRHVIRKGETLGAISQRYQISVAALKQVNRLDDDRIRAGATLMVPSSLKPIESYTLSVAARRAERGRRPQPRGRATYTVRKGDSLWTIARRNRVTVSNLAAWNGLRRSATLRPGRKLTVRPPSRRARAIVVSRQSGGARNVGTPGARRIRYTVRSGDSLWEISRRFRVSVASLRKWNRLPPGRYLQPGQQLTVLLSVGRPTTTSS